jgi:glycosyltransferase involved in cell wall biosynthesis
MKQRVPEMVSAKPRVSALFCSLNEATNLPHELPKIPRRVSEVILVDGHSRDNTVEVAKVLCLLI